MHERHEVEKALKQKAREISEELNGADIVIIAAGGQKAKLNRTMTASTYDRDHPGRLRDLLGILETAKQIETIKHFDQTKFA